MTALTIIVMALVLIIAILIIDDLDQRRALDFWQTEYIALDVQFRALNKELALMGQGERNV